MHAWARHLVHEASQHLRPSHAYSQQPAPAAVASAFAYHSSGHIDDHRDSDLQLLLPLPSPSRQQRAKRSKCVGVEQLSEEAADAAASPPLPPAPSHQQLEHTAAVAPLNSAPSSLPAPCPFRHDLSLHPYIRKHVFRYGSTLTASSAPPFFPLGPDAATAAFLSSCATAFYSSSRCCSAYYLTHLLVKPLVSLCLSHTDVNGLLGTGHMFLLSSQQLLALFAHHSGGAQPGGALLDVGAGSGEITAQLAPFFSSVTCTEVSRLMCRRLRRRGWEVHRTGTLSALPPAARFDVVLCFNVIDRCSHPRSLLSGLCSRLRSAASLLLLATPLPLDPWVEVGKQWQMPEEGLLGLELGGTAAGGGGGGSECVCCLSWEQSVERLSLLFLLLGFAVLSVSRLPYISAGNAYRPFFVLDDALFVLARQQEIETLD